MVYLLTFLDLLNFFFMLVATVGPLYMANKVRNKNQRLFSLAVLLGTFTLIHGVYHLLDFLGASYLADVIFYPLSSVLLLCFGILYWRTGV